MPCTRPPNKSGHYASNPPVVSPQNSFFNHILKIYLFIFRERRREREREGEKHQCVIASQAPPTGDLAHNPGMCPDWESNRRPFGSKSGTQSTEPHKPGQVPKILFSQLYKNPFQTSLVHPSLSQSMSNNITIWAN